jgi:hypothetical protein
MRLSRMSIPSPARVDPVRPDDLWGNYFREPRKDALLEGLTITDGITFFDGFEDRPTFCLR